MVLLAAAMFCGLEEEEVISGGFPFLFLLLFWCGCFSHQEKMMIIMTMWLNACLSKLLILFPRFIAHQKVVLFMLSFPCFLFLSLGMEILERYIIIIIIIVVQSPSSSLLLRVILVYHYVFPEIHR